MASFWNVLTGKSSHPPSSSFATTTDTPFPSSASTPTVEDLSSFISPSLPYDPSSIHPLADLSSSTLDYISLDEASPLLSGTHSGALPSRTFTDDLCYGTGTTYLTALTAGGIWGFFEGLRKTPPTAPPKLRLNSVLNAVTRRGPFLGNNAGVIALGFTAMNAGIGKVRGKHDAANSVIAGILAGALWKSTRGPKAMVVAGGLTGLAAGAWVVGGRVLQ